MSVKLSRNLALVAAGALLLLAGGCRTNTAAADDAVDAFMGRVAAGDEVGARAFWAWDYPMGSLDQMTLYSRLVRDLSEAGQRVGWEQHSVFYYRDAAFSQPVERARQAQVSQVDMTMFVIGPGQSRAEERLTLVLARVQGTPQEWKVLAVRTDPQVVRRFADEVAMALGGGE